MKLSGRASVSAWSVRESVVPLLYLRNEWTCFNETDRSYSLPGLHDTDDIEVTELGQKLRSASDGQRNL